MAWDVARVAGVREIVGPEVRLMVDYKQSLTASGALRRIRALARFDLERVEEPVPARATPASAKRPRSPSRPARTGGSGTTWPTPSRPRLRPLYAHIMKMGGVTGWLRAIGQAEAAAVPVSSHLSSRPAPTSCR